MEEACEEACAISIDGAVDFGGKVLSESLKKADTSKEAICFGSEGVHGAESPRATPCAWAMMMVLTVMITPKYPFPLSMPPSQ